MNKENLKIYIWNYGPYYSQEIYVVSVYSLENAQKIAKANGCDKPEKRKPKILEGETFIGDFGA